MADNQGTVRDLAVVNSGVTTVVNHRVFSAFGQMLSQTNPSVTPPTAAAVDCLFGFTGLPFDTASGFNMSQTRPYDPATGRWDAPDRDSFTAGDTNLYRYCGNSPTNATDPTGQFEEWPLEQVHARISAKAAENAHFEMMTPLTATTLPGVMLERSTPTLFAKGLKVGTMERTMRRKVRAF